ncbi:MAG: efflux RND transporter periplasmic adaptor subunit [Lentisphaeria bacterium]|nr:efflux RND transporter periplasmic adaptor subunit [Lentisphaeria bacterium]
MKCRKLNQLGRVCAVLVAVLAFAGCGKKQEQAAPVAMPVSSVTIKTESILLYSELPGRVAPYLIAEIRPQVSGLIQKRLFKEGAEVKEGDVLYEIDPAPYQASLSNVEAALAVAKAQHVTAVAAESRAKAGLANAEALVRVASAGRDTAVAALEAVKTALTAAKAAQASAEANAEPLRLRAARFKELLESKAVSQQDYDDVDSARRQAESGIEQAMAAVAGAAAELVRAEAAVKVADAEIERSQAGLLSSKAEVEGAAAGVTSSLAGIQSAEAMLDTARINLGYTKITAPISGRIGRSNITVGALVTAHQPLALATVQQLDQVYVDVPQASAELLRLQHRIADGRLSRNGTQNVVKLNLEDGKPYPLEGTLQFRDVTVDQSTGSFILRMEFSNPQRTLLPGMFVRAKIEEGVKEDAILVPQQAVTRDPKGNSMVMLIDEAGKVATRAVRLDRAISNQWLISEGLKVGDRVIFEGLQRIRPGVSVTETAPVNPGGKPAAVEKKEL